MDVKDFVSTFGGCTPVPNRTLISKALVLSGLAESNAQAKRFFKANMVRLDTYGSESVQDRELDKNADGDHFFLLAGKNVRIIQLTFYIIIWCSDILE